MKINLLLLSSSLLVSTCLYAQLGCDSAMVIEPGIYTIGSIDGEEIPIPICAPNGMGNTSKSMWYSYTPGDTVQATIYTSFSQNQGVDNRVHVYGGTCATLECVAGDDDSGSGLLCHVSWVANADETYLIAFDNRWTSAGFDFELQTEIIVIENPDFTFNTIDTPFLTRTLGAVDMNGDYLDDVLDVSSTSVFTLIQYSDPPFIYEAVTTPTASYPYSWSIAAGDIDGNGYNDLLYGSGQGVSFMYRNEDGVGFTHWSDPNYVFSQRSNFVDLNNDGHLDGFVCHDVAPNVYYINDGEGNLSFNQGGMSDVIDGGNYGSIFVDYNNDGLPDLFIAKCRGGNSLANYNQLFENNGDGTFTEVSVESGLYDPVQTWSSAWGDFDNDGWMDVLVGASSFSQGGHKLMRNNGDGTFSDVTEGSGFNSLSATGIEWVAYDFDNDGYIDILGANGHFMMNNGDMTFSVSTFPQITNGPIGDINNDGFLDICNNGKLHLNNGNDNNWVKLNTKGVASNINGIGARVELYTPAGKQIRDVQSGVGFRFMNTLNVHFGIGTETQIDSLIVLWPSGTVDVHYDFEIDTFHLLEEGETEEEENTVGLDQTEMNSFEVYPNPAQDFIIVKSHQNAATTQIQMFDIQGRLMLSKVLTGNANNQRIELGHLPAGVYIIKFMGEGDASQVKLMKTK